jgi:outer membrane protein assembly factor BamD
MAGLLSCPRMTQLFRLSTRVSLLALILLALGAVACGSKKDAIPTGVGEPDKFLFDKGTTALTGHKWLTAREYFRRIIDSYPQSDYRPDAKIGVADSYLGEGTTESVILAVNEYREFLTFYPTNPRADYAQYKLGMTHFKQMRKPQRDQTETREAVRELEAFMDRYPNSKLKPEADQKLREAKDRLSTSEYQVGVFYFKQRWYPGAIDRLRSLLKTDPGFTLRDGAYYYLGEALLKVKLDAEALPYFDKLIAEFQKSEFLEPAQQRQAQLRATMDKAGSPAVPPSAGTPVPAADQKPARVPAPTGTTVKPTPPPTPTPTPQR